MRIAVIGAGGVGGYFGARLAAAGEEVIFVQRGPHLAAMKDQGLTVRSPLGDVSLSRPQAVDGTEGLGPVDIVLVTVKSNNTEAAGALAKPLLGPETAVISLQNGVENEDRLAAIVGPEHVMAGTAYILSLVEAPGVIVHGGRTARLVFGERGAAAAGKSARGEAFLEACRRAGIDAELSEAIESALWAKFAVLCPHNGMTALTRLPIGPIREDPDCRAVLLQATEEGMALADRRGIALPPTLRDDPMGFIDGLPPEMTSSMHYDITHGRPLELEWLNGAIVRLAREVDLAAPANRFIYAGLKLHAAGGG